MADQLKLKALYIEASATVIIRKIRAFKQQKNSECTRELPEWFVRQWVRNTGDYTEEIFEIWAHAIDLAGVKPSSTALFCQRYPAPHNELKRKNCGWLEDLQTEIRGLW